MSAYMVTNTNQFGPGSFRQGILDVNNVSGVTPGVDTIDFDIPGNGPFVIRPDNKFGPLPRIQNFVTIDGLSQPGASSLHPQIVLDGSLLSSPASGFDFGVGTVDASVVRGLVIDRFPDEGIVVDPLNRGGLEVSNCFIGTDASGTLGLGNRDDGIFEDAQSNLATFKVKNATISGNAGDGIEIDGQGANGGLIENSFIGTNAVGTVGLGNGLRGIDLGTGSGGIQIRDNVISGNAADGVFLQGGASGVSVQGNFIGTNPGGTAAIGNGFSGVAILDSSGNVVGGTEPGDGNVISGNHASGVVLDLPNAQHNQVLGNLIGTDASGRTAVPNLIDGVFVLNGASNNVIGGTSALARNLISGNLGRGVEIDLPSTTGNQVQGNYIGTDVTGSLPLGNQDQGVLLGNTSGNVVGGTAAGSGNVIAANLFNGIYIGDGGGNSVLGNLIGTDASGTLARGNALDGIIVVNSINNIIGGTVSGAANLVAFNRLAGVAIGIDRSDPATGNAIRGNSIHDNHALGIDLGSDGVTPNDPLDGDIGPNNLQNFPVLKTVVVQGGLTHIVGVLNSAANTSFVIDFYASATPDPSGFGQGQTYLGSALATTGSDGKTIFAVDLTAVPLGEFVTATATDPGGNTSEFSRARGVARQSLTAELPMAAAPVTAPWAHLVTNREGQLSYLHSKLEGRAVRTNQMFSSKQSKTTPSIARHKPEISPGLDSASVDQIFSTIWRP
jgi:hypothetical protein